MSTHKPPASSGSLQRLLIWIVILSIWEGAFRLSHWDPAIFPAPSHVAAATIQMFDSANGAMAISLGISLLRLIVGYLFTVILGAIVGWAMWRSNPIDGFLGPLLLGLQALPSVCWIPLALILPGLGSSERGVIFVTVMGSTFALALSLRDGLRAIPHVYQRSGLMLGASGWKLYRYVLLPSSLPAVATSLRLGFSFAWRSLMGAEVLFTVSRTGLGNLLSRARTDVGKVVAVMAVMVVVGMLADRFVFAKFQAAVHRRFGLG